jgi:hypothetical protein
MAAERTICGNAGLTSAVGRAILSLLALCGAFVSDATPLAGNEGREGTARFYAVTLNQARAAITNAFSDDRYHELLIAPTFTEWDPRTRRWSKRPTTNQWAVFTADSPLTTITWGKKSVPYYADFDIAVNSISTNQCRIVVRTTSAWIPGGLEIGIHSGWARGAKNIPPILQEETNVLSQIEMEMRLLQSGGTNQAVPMRHLDTDPDWLIKWRDLGTLNPQLKEDLIRAVQQETNSAKREELQKLLTAMTNSVPK